MFRLFKPFFIIAETPLHPGSGSELGIVDLPIQRERYTNYPKIEGSGLKGCIREAFENSTKKVKLNSNELQANDNALISLIFGPEKPEKAEEHAGCLAFTDAKVLLFPVKSLKGVFAWITCPIVLTRFFKDMQIADKGTEIQEWNINNVANTIPKQSNILISGNVVLEEFTFEVRETNEATKIAEKLADMVFPDITSYSFWKDKLKKDLVILSDNDFRDFVTTSTEVITRTRIVPETGTVEPGALWTEEYLPQDTILYSIAMTTAIQVKEDNKKEPLKGDTPDEEAQKVMEFFIQGLPEIIHIGGNQTIGKGIVRIKIM